VSIYSAFHTGVTKLLDDKTAAQDTLQFSPEGGYVMPTQSLVLNQNGAGHYAKVSGTYPSWQLTDTTTGLSAYITNGTEASQGLDYFIVSDDSKSPLAQFGRVAATFPHLTISPEYTCSTVVTLTLGNGAGTGAKGSETGG